MWDNFKKIKKKKKKTEKEKTRNHKLLSQNEHTKQSVPGIARNAFETFS